MPDGMTHPEVIDVWPDRVPDNDLWRDAGPEGECPSWATTRLIRNVSRPTLTVYLPEPLLATGTGVVVCPGGAFHFLAIDKEGTDVARWLTDRGVAAFVLRYRVVPTPDDDAFLRALAANPTPFRPQMDQVRPMVIADGRQALRTIRMQASRWTIDPGRLGILGFSAGLYAAVGAATSDDAASRPSFAAGLYGEWWERSVPADAPPLFLAAASDDPLIDVRLTTGLYDAWYAAGRSAELHLYARGGHGFALIPQGLPVDDWSNRFWAWLGTEGFGPMQETRR